MLLGKSGGQLLIAPDRMKRLGQSIMMLFFWMHPMVKAKSEAIKNNISFTGLTHVLKSIVLQCIVLVLTINSNTVTVLKITLILQDHSKLGFITYCGSFLPLPINFSASSLAGTCSVTVLQASQANVKI